MPRTRLPQAFRRAQPRLRPQVHHRLQQGVPLDARQDAQDHLGSQVQQRAQDPLRRHHPQGLRHRVHQRSQADLQTGVQAGKYVFTISSAKRHVCMHIINNENVGRDGQSWGRTRELLFFRLFSHHSTAEPQRLLIFFCCTINF
jgi:hypothetical protein